MDARYVWVNGKAVARARWYLRRADQVGNRVRVFGRPLIVNGGRMVIGERVQLISTVATLEMVSDVGGLLEIGDGTFVNSGCSIAATQLVRIGADCHIGPHTMMLDNDFHRIEPERRNERPPSAPIIIGDNVWIGSRVIITSGTTIGTGSCVAAGSIVTKDVPARTLVAGVPARVIRTL